MTSSIPVQGLYLPEAELWLDPQRSQRLAVISHAHADHVASHETTICTPATAALLRARYRHPGTQLILAYHTPHSVGPYLLELLPAGHVLGSAMVHVTRKSDGATLLYTGDFKLRPSPTAEMAMPKRADTLIMETTFGQPHYVFPPEAAVRAEVIAWCRAALAAGETPLLLGYSLGKAQEILAMLSGADLPIMVHETVWEMCQVYEHCGISFPEYRKFSAAAATGCVIILPPMVVKHPAILALPNRVTALLTGWGMDARSRYQTSTDLVLPLSDHADYPDLLRLVALVQPQLVLTTHGFAADFAQDLRARGQAAWMLEGTEQLQLALAADPVKSNHQLPLVTNGESPWLAWLECVRSLHLAKRPTPYFKLAEHLKSLSDEMLVATVDWLDATRWSPSQRPHWSHVRAAVLAITNWHVSTYRALTQQLSDPQLALPTALAQVAHQLQPQRFGLEELYRRVAAVLEAISPAEKIALLTQLFRQLTPAESHGVVQWLYAEPGLAVREAVLVPALAEALLADPAQLREAWWTTGSWSRCALLAKQQQLAQHGLRLFSPLHVPASPGGAWQFHVQAGRGQIFDESRRDVTKDYPAFASISSSDAEFIGIGRPIPGDLLSEATGPLYTVHDLLWWQGQSLGGKTLTERLACLAGCALPSEFSISKPAS